MTIELKEAYARLITDTYGLRLSQQQMMQLDIIVARLLRRLPGNDSASLLSRLQAGRCPDLLDELGTQFVIGETHFFRVEPQVKALRDVVLPGIIAQRTADRVLRVWSAGCSTGEEPYTVAMLLREQVVDVSAWDVTILATDLNPAALAAAKVASYGTWSFRGTSADVQQRYFVARDGRQNVKEAISSLVTFRQLNLAAPHFPVWVCDQPFDLILCRNVTIYLDPAVTSRIYRRFAEALTVGGWLILGPSDPPPDASSGLSPLSVGDSVLWRRTTEVELSVQSPMASRQTRRAQRTDTERTPTSRKRPSDQARHDRVKGAVPPPHAMQHPVAPRLDAHSTDPQAYLVPGLRHLESGDGELAVNCLRRAVFLRSDDAVAQFALGRAYLLQRQSARAASALVHARRLLFGQDDDDTVPGTDKLHVGELRFAIEATLAMISNNDQHARGVAR